MTSAQEALSILKSDGWRKGKIGSLDNPKCILGAFKYTMGGLTDRRYKILEEIIREQFPDRTNIFAVSPFNDHPDTTFADVELVLEKMAVKESEVL